MHNIVAGIINLTWQWLCTDSESACVDQAVSGLKSRTFDEFKGHNLNGERDLISGCGFRFGNFSRALRATLPLLFKNPGYAPENGFMP